jgi:Cytochrome P450
MVHVKRSNSWAAGCCWSSNHQCSFLLRMMLLVTIVVVASWSCCCCSAAFQHQNSRRVVVFSPGSSSSSWFTPTPHHPRRAPASSATLVTLSSCPVPLEFRRSPSTLFSISTTMNDTLTYSPEIATTVSSSSSSSCTTATVPKLLGPASGLGFLAASLAGKPHKYLAFLQKRHGVENFILRGGGGPKNNNIIVVLNNPAAIRDVLETYNLPKTAKVRLGYKSIFYGNTKSNKSGGKNSGGILAAPWNKWLQQRRMAAPALAERGGGSSSCWAPQFYDASLPFFQYLESQATSSTTDRKQQPRQQAVDMSAAFTAVTMDAIGTILLGKSFGMCQRLPLQHKQQQQQQPGRGDAAEVVPFAAALHRLTGK